SFGAGKAGDGLGPLFVLHHQGHIQATGVEDSTLGIADRQDSCPDSMQQLCGDATGVAKTLDDRGGAAVVDILDFAGAARDVDAALCRSLMSSLGAAEKRGLAGHDSGNTVPTRHTVGIHDPSHDLGIGVDVRGGNIAVRSDEVGYLVSVAACEAL